MLDNSPHVPFFTPFFNGLASATQEQLDLLPELLKQFLSSPAVNERTDDDKTLAHAENYPAYLTPAAGYHP
ncbi:hypothetical protein KX245_21670, partial [Escherichia coli]|nr:hypothetical protein [Escherichia coli]